MTQLASCRFADLAFSIAVQPGLGRYGPKGDEALIVVGDLVDENGNRLTPEEAARLCRVLSTVAVATTGNRQNPCDGP